MWRRTHHVVRERVVLVELVHGRGPPAAVEADRKSGVGHAQWPQDPLGEHLGQRLALDPRQRDAEHVGGVAVREPIAGLMRERQRGQLGQPAVLVLPSRHASRRPGPSGGGTENAVRQPAAVRHQVVDRDGPPDRLASCPADRRGSRSTRMSASSGSHLVDRIGQRQLAVLDQRHRCGDRDRLGHRGDAEDRVALHRQTRVDVAVAELVDLPHLAGMPDQRDRAGEQAGVDRLADGGLIASSFEYSPAAASGNLGGRRSGC